MATRARSTLGASTISVDAACQLRLRGKPGAHGFEGLPNVLLVRVAGPLVQPPGNALASLACPEEPVLNGAAQHPESRFLGGRQNAWVCRIELGSDRDREF